jgi:hypothetical protein
VTGEDYYVSAREIGRRLSALGFTKREIELDDAIASGSTATEILMKLRWILQSIGATEVLPQDVAFEVGDLARRIKQALTQ